MVVVTDRKRRLHKQRVLKKLRFFLFLFLSLFLISILIWTVFFSSLFEIKEIIILGVDPIDTVAIQEIVNQSLSSHSWFFIPPLLRPFLENISFNTKNFLWQNFSLLESNLRQKFPEYSESQIKFNLWQRGINLSMSKRSLAAVWCSEDTCGLIDANGIYFKTLELNDAALLMKEPLYADYPFLKGELKGTTNKPEVGSSILPGEVMKSVGDWYRNSQNSRIAFKEIVLSESYLTCLKAKTIAPQAEITFNPENSVANIMLAVQALQEKIKNNPTWQGLKSLNFCFYPKIYYTPENFFTH